MLFSAYRPKRCAICTFEVAEWLAPLTQTPKVCAGTQLQPFSTTGPRMRTPDARKNIIPEYAAAQWRNRIEQPRGPRFDKPIRSKYSSPRDPNLRHPGKRSVRLDSAGPQTVPSKYSVFESLVLEQVRNVMSELKWYSPKERAIIESWGMKSDEELKAKAFQFKIAISKSFELAEKDGLIDKENNTLYYRLLSAFISGDVRGLGREVYYSFLDIAVNLKFSKEELENQRRIADLRYPVEWFPATRALQRTVHLHVGPTNSGKTYHALQRLEAAKTGIYAGPLRLLAHEVYTRFNAKGKPCALVTGEERRFPENLKVVMNSCTVEMVPLNTKVDVAVIDEIQMIGDDERGWAWTQAFLGVQAKEVHLCGEARTVPLIKELCAEAGDKLEIHEYERLSPLQTSNKHLGTLKNLQKGDAVIVFSRLGIHAMKSEIERATSRRCAVVYGSLPPETRAQQANLFNDPDNDYDFLVASDAIGMGLNLAIKRVIFESTAKNNGQGGHEILDNSAIKQIGGRAGRYKTARDAVQVAVTDGVDEEIYSNTSLQAPEVEAPKQNIGYVTSIEKFDLEVISRGMKAEIEPLKQAGIFPPSSVINRFASCFPPKTPFSYIILRLHELAAISPRYKICRLKDQIDVADAIQGFRLTTNDRLIFMAAPASLRDPGLFGAVQEMARCVAEQSGGELLDLKCLNLELLDTDLHEYGGRTSDYLRAVESLHKILTLYLWLSYRFNGVFRSQPLAFHVKSLVEDKIDLCLQEVNWDESQRLRNAKARERLLRKASLGAKESVEEKPEESTELMDEEDEDVDSSEVDVVDPEDSPKIASSTEPSLDSAQASELPGNKSGGNASDARALTDSFSLPADEVARVIERGALSQRASQNRGALKVLDGVKDSVSYV